MRLGIKSRLLSRCRQEDRGYSSPCLVWTGEVDKDGYGRIKYHNKYIPTHWVLDGRPPKGYDKDHLCHQRDCVRPSHLENVTRSVNTARRMASGPRRSVTAEERSVATQLLRDGMSVADVANVTGLSRRTVGRIRAGLT